MGQISIHYFKVGLTKLLCLIWVAIFRNATVLRDGIENEVIRRYDRGKIIEIAASHSHTTQAFR